MKNKVLYQVLKWVGITASPLLLSMAIVLGAVVAVGPTLSPYLHAVKLFVQKTDDNASSEPVENVFQGYEKPDHDEDGENEITEIDGNTISYPKRGDLYAILEVESVGLETNVFFDDSDETLTRGGVGQSYSTLPAGFGSPMLITGHNNGAFSTLQHVKVGDIITMTTTYGIFEYEVRECAVKSKNDTTIVDLAKKEEELVLYTCYPFTLLGLTEQRYFVYADKISGPTVLH